MNADKKIHLLSQELILIINELDAEPKQIVLDHIQNCEECKQLYDHVLDVDASFPEHEFSNDVEIKPLKRLAQFNTGLKLLLVAVRFIILFYILYTGFKFHDSESSWMTIDYINSGILLFYIPAAVFLIVFTITFFNRKWVWISLATDLFVIFFLNQIVGWFL